MTTPKVACFSVAVLDQFPQQGRSFPGGNSLNQTLRFRQLGYESCFLGALGTDPEGDQLEGLLRKNGVDVSHLSRVPGRTAGNQIVNDELGERFGVEGAWKGGVYDSFRLTEADWRHIEAHELWATHANGPNYAPALKAKGKGNFLVVDFLHFDTYELLDQGRDQVDIAYFGGVKRQAADLVAYSRTFGGVLVLTLGAEGSLAFHHGRTYEQAALPLTTVADTTGCGDAFQAGFTAEYYASRDVTKALLAGATLGREAASHYGGVPW